MTQLVCHEDRTPNRFFLARPKPLEHERWRHTGRARFAIKEKDKNDLSRPTAFSTAIEKPFSRRRYGHDDDNDDDGDDDGEISVTPNCESEANIYIIGANLLPAFSVDSSAINDFRDAEASLIRPRVLCRASQKYWQDRGRCVVHFTSSPFYRHYTTGNRLSHAPQLYRLIEHLNLWTCTFDGKSGAISMNFFLSLQMRNNC